MKTKYILIISLLILIIIAVFFWYNTIIKIEKGIKEEIKKPEIELSNKIIEKEKFKCPGYSQEKLTEILNDFFTIPNETSYDFFNSLFNEPIKTSFLINDDLLKEYLMENINLNFSNYVIIKSIHRGYFDKIQPNKKTIIVFFETASIGYRGLPSTRTIIFQEEIENNWCSFYQDIGFSIEIIDSKKIIQDEPILFFAERTNIGGTCLPFERYFMLYRLENKKFNLFFEDIFRKDGVNYDYEKKIIEEINTTIEFEDLNNNNNLEIIKKGVTRFCVDESEIGCYFENCDKELISEEEVYVIYQWDENKKEFITSTKNN